VKASRFDWIRPRSRVINHWIHWNDEDPRAPICFSAIVDKEAAGWATVVLEVMKKT